MQCCRGIAATQVKPDQDGAGACGHLPPSGQPGQATPTLRLHSNIGRLGPSNLPRNRQSVPVVSISDAAATPEGCCTACGPLSRVCYSREGLPSTTSTLSTVACSAMVTLMQANHNYSTSNVQGLQKDPALEVADTPAPAAPRTDLEPDNEALQPVDDLEPNDLEPSQAALFPPFSEGWAGDVQAPNEVTLTLTISSSLYASHGTVGVLILWK